MKLDTRFIDNKIWIFFRGAISNRLLIRLAQKTLLTLVDNLLENKQNFIKFILN